MNNFVSFYVLRKGDSHARQTIRQMKAILLPSLVLTIITSQIVPAANAQQIRGYEEHTRFPGLRKAFRQIRYHAGALRDTASNVRHDLKYSIRGGAGRHRHEHGHLQDGYHNEDIYPPLERPSTPVYEEFYYRTEPKVRRLIEKPMHSAPRTRDRREVPLETDPELQIVAPRKPPVLIQSSDETDVAAETESQPEPNPDPKPKPESKPEPGTNPVVEKPIVGKIVYPEAKRSKRPGFHFSPYEPYELLDTRGIDTGELAKDPGNGKIFRIPK
jgi:hypothetical protein